ncbi:MAG: SGNH/GDSL hydrolase family protein [Clostridia bacterium]|nr:SGNH/GDSL hydrolase family protein [Clostridia bacterium]
MKLTLEQIRALIHGAVTVEESADGKFSFCRFTASQKAAYEPGKNITTQVPATAGMRLEFVTDSDTFSFDYLARSASSRRYYYFDVYLDGVMVKHFGHKDVKAVASTLTVKLPEGVHTVAVYFPNLFSVQISKVTVDDGATVEPVQKSCRMVCYGDSITQGYDAVYPSRSYVNQLADKLNADVIDFGIGGEVFRPELVTRELDFEPDIVTVAYGSNDFTKKKSREDMVRDANEFHARARAAYPNAKIFAVTPVWRYDGEKITAVGSFADAVRIAYDAAAAQPGVVVVDGSHMTPHSVDYYYDGLHPTDSGFSFYANALYAAMKPHLNQK